LLSAPVAPGGDLHERLASFDIAVLSQDRRTQALDRCLSSKSGRERPGRYWRVDLEAILPNAAAIDGIAGSVRIHSSHPRVVACDLATAARLHPALLARAFGTTTVAETKFGALATAFAGLGAFVYVPADVASDEPIAVTYEVPDGAAAFPYTVVLAERGARATVIERVEGGQGEAFVCGATEIVTEEHAEIVYASSQRLSSTARVFQTRAARPGRDARLSWACAELGSALAVTDISVAIQRPGVDAQIAAIFFPQGSQHVDVISTVDHIVGDSDSETTVKSAAVGRGQARFLGNIRIARDAQGTNANLRDDALLLSPKAHIDSVPALEIAANDVKAYHGATVGALDDEQIFYMASRGIEPNAAERMIALGFFEPAIARFPSDALRDEIRTALAAKLA
jgi:Fe-S cluster assembly protein SufD